MRLSFRAYFDWVEHVVAKPGGSTQLRTLLWAVPPIILSLPFVVMEVLGSCPGPTVLTDWQHINLSPCAVAGWLALIGSGAWIGYALVATLRSMWK